MYYMYFHPADLLCRLLYSCRHVVRRVVPSYLTLLTSCTLMFPTVVQLYRLLSTFIFNLYRLLHVHFHSPSCWPFPQTTEHVQIQSCQPHLRTDCYLHSCGILLTFCSDSCTFILNAVDRLYRLNNNTQYFLIIPVGLLYRKLYKIVLNFVYEVYRFLYISIFHPLNVYTRQNPRPHVVLTKTSQMRTICTCT